MKVLACNGSGTTSGVVAGVDWGTAQKNSNPSQPTVAAAINSNATTGVVSSPGNGTPNRLLYTLNF